MTGEVETEDNVLVIRRIHVHLRLAAPSEVGDIVERVHQVYAMQCPLYRTLRTAIAITTSYEVVPLGPG